MSGNDMDLPFEPSSGHLVDEHALLSGGVVVMASVVDVPQVGKRPALVFRFATPTGDFYPPVVLVLEADQMAKTTDLVARATAAAIEASR